MFEMLAVVHLFNISPQHRPLNLPRAKSWQLKPARLLIASKQTGCLNTSLNNNDNYNYSENNKLETKQRFLARLLAESSRVSERADNKEVNPFSTLELASMVNLLPTNRPGSRFEQEENSLSFSLSFSLTRVASKSAHLPVHLRELFVLE